MMSCCFSIKGFEKSKEGNCSLKGTLMESCFVGVMLSTSTSAFDDDNKYIMISQSWMIKRIKM